MGPKKNIYKSCRLDRFPDLIDVKIECENWGWGVMRLRLQLKRAKRFAIVLLVF